MEKLEPLYIAAAAKLLQSCLFSTLWTVAH